MLRNAIRQLSTSARKRNAKVDALIGSREAIAAKRDAFETKYRERLLAKAREKGIELEELKAQAELKRKSKSAFSQTSSHNASASPKASADGLLQLPKSALPAGAKSTSPSIPPLTTIMDVPKLLSRDPAPSRDDIARLWQGYHASAASETKLGAVVSHTQYTKMLSVARKYPEFVIPLPRQLEDGQNGAEMIFLQWAFLPSADGNVDTATVLFTSLAAFKAHGTFAQPALCLTHYTDLSASHDLILLRGEITTTDKGTVSMSGTDAQLLCLRLQQYYGSDGDTDKRKMLEQFHKGDINLDELVQTAWQV